MKAKAFSPGHISGFFEPVYFNNDFSRSGSRGAGLSITLGAVSEVSAIESSIQKIEVFINGKRSPAPVTKLALEYLIGKNKLNISVKTKLSLPMGQGFGMSAAGALSSAIALSKICGLTSSDAMKAAHFAEVNLKTGLGDVVSSFIGGFEVRKTPGIPPWGIIEHIPGNYNIVLCIVGKKVNTSKILSNKNTMSVVSDYGKLCTKKLLEKPSVENLFYLSNVFSSKTGLANKKVQKIIAECKNFGNVSMCMLGNSIFAVGKTNELCNIFFLFVKTYVCSVDESGARIIE